MTTCELTAQSEEYRKCGRPAVSIWEARDGDLAVCEQCEAAILADDCGHGRKFRPLPLEAR